MNLEHRDVFSFLKKEDLEIRYSKYVGELVLFDSYPMDELEREYIREAIVGYDENGVRMICLIDAYKYIPDIDMLDKLQLQKRLSDYLRSKK